MGHLTNFKNPKVGFKVLEFEIKNICKNKFSGYLWTFLEFIDIIFLTIDENPLLGCFLKLQQLNAILSIIWNANKY